MDVKEYLSEQFSAENPDVNKIISKLYVVDANKEAYILKSIDEYENKHEILLREDKKIKVKVNGEERAQIVPVVKLLLPYQEDIVNKAVAFIFGKPVTLNNNDSQSDEVFKLVKDNWKSLKLDTILRRVATKVFVETKAAILFYPDLKTSKEKNDNGEEEVVIKARKLRCLILAKSEGDDIYPHFDQYGDMDAFIRKYSILDDDNKKIDCVDIYTDTDIYQCKKKSSWEITTQKNPCEKIPIIYISQAKKEWDRVQCLIDRQESLLSKNADSNDYFGSPAMITKGKVKNLPDKGEVGKLFQIEGEKDASGKTEYGDINVLAWDRAPESIKLEHEINDGFINSFTSTPKMNVESLKSLGNLSGVALRLLFFDPSLKAMRKQEYFGEAIERIINLLKAMIGTFIDVGKKDLLNKLDISVTFGDPIPQNVTELIDMLAVATAGKSFMSQDSAVSINPLVKDSKAELEKLKQEEESSIEQTVNNLPKSFNEE